MLFNISFCSDCQILQETSSRHGKICIILHSLPCAPIPLVAHFWSFLNLPVFQKLKAAAAAGT